MSKKRITSIEDLAGIAGAELGTKQSKSQIEKDAEAVTTKPEMLALSPDLPNPIVISNNEVVAETEVTNKPAKDHLTVLYNAFELGHVVLPTGRIVLKDIREEPNPINGYTRTLKKNKLPELIKEELARAQRLREIYEKNLKLGDNVYGFVFASIAAERDAARMNAYLAELEEKA